MGLISHQSTSNLTSIEGEHQDIRSSQLLDSTHQQPQQVDYYQQQQAQSVDQSSQNWQQQQQQPIDQLDYSQQPVIDSQLKQTSYDNTQYADPYWNQQSATQIVDQPVAAPVWGDNVDAQQQMEEKSLMNDYWNAGTQNEVIVLLK